MPPDAGLNPELQKLDWKEILLWHSHSHHKAVNHYCSLGFIVRQDHYPNVLMSIPKEMAEVGHESDLAPSRGVKAADRSKPEHSCSSLRGL